ncbi:hypothetical protein VTJ49DRAFT_5680 [Mycothermus thermophilus]|uniref:Uncharacterized protein n=1 Tax=Humicola insolens TaxID=85995 RepID=A0ABR3V2N3_HUMIN
MLLRSEVGISYYSCSPPSVGIASTRPLEFQSRVLGLWVVPRSTRHAGPLVQIASTTFPRVSETSFRPPPVIRSVAHLTVGADLLRLGQLAVNCVIGWQSSVPRYKRKKGIYTHSKPARKASCSDTRQDPSISPSIPVPLLPACASIARPEKSPHLFSVSALPCGHNSASTTRPRRSFCLRCRRPDPSILNPLDPRTLLHRPSLGLINELPTGLPQTAPKSPNLHSDRNPHHFLFHSGASPIDQPFSTLSSHPNLQTGFHSDASAFCTDVLGRPLPPAMTL